MGIRAMVVRPGEYGEIVHLSERHWGDELARLIDTDAIQPFNRLSNHTAMWVDEDGALKSLSLNVEAVRIATEIAGRQVIPLVGTVIFTGVILRGRITNLPENIGPREG